MTGYASLGEVAEALRRLTSSVKTGDAILLDVPQTLALAALLDVCRTTTDEGVLARALNLKDALTLGDPS